MKTTWPLSLLLLAPSCIVPQAILPAGIGELSLNTFPAETELIEIPVPGGPTLRGVFVPAGPDAPVVLHLLEAEASVTWGGELVDGVVDEGPGAGWPLFAELQAAGIASLAADWEGCGASGGGRSPTHLRRDTLALWGEALRRAGGDPGRVGTRGASMGTIATASLLNEGMEPAGVVLISPVRAETVAKHWAYHYFWDVLAFLAVPLLKDAGDADLIAEIAATSSPLLVLEPKHDFLLPPEEQELLEAAVESAAGTLLWSDLGHEANCVRSHNLIRGELGFWNRAFAE